MIPPTVSFVVLCYKLAHYLGESLRSILAQTYTDFEILVMDDCSPDDTHRVAASFNDPRIRYIRQPVNLGGYANLNDGLSRCRGAFVWVISADDYIRTDYALARYMEVIRLHPEAGMVFCPSMEVVRGQEREMGWGYHGPDVLIYPPGGFFATMVKDGNQIAGSSGLVRKEFYDRFGFWPVDLPHTADCFEYSLIALHYGVIYLPDTMTCWRRHELQWTEQYENELAHVKTSSDIAVRWRLRAHAQQHGLAWAIKVCEESIIADYVERVTNKLLHNWKYGLDMDGLDASLQKNAEGAERTAMRSQVMARLIPRLIRTGDQCYFENDRTQAKACYELALKVGGPAAALRVRLSIVAMGWLGRKLANRRGLMRRIEAATNPAVTLD